MTEFDNTHLSIDYAENCLLIHRDYIAHCLRWSFVYKWLYTGGGRWKTAHVLDIGAGKELPLYKMICSNRMTKMKYTGVDINKLELPITFAKRSVECNLYSETEFLDLPEEAYKGINMYTCFEVLEHVPPKYARTMLETVHDHMKDDHHFFVSTPCFDEHVGKADNHVNEMTREALGYLLEEIGFEILENYGTFASQRDYQQHMSPEVLTVFKELSKYYHHHYLATVLAPMYPEYARNNIWLLKKRDVFSPRKFPNKPEGRWSSSEDWKELLQ